jgi:hypothetical protein
MSSMPPDPSDDAGVATDALLRRIEALERENQRLRERLEPIIGVLPPDNPNFHPAEFVKALRRAMFVVMLPIYLVGPVALLTPFVAPKLAAIQIGPLRVIDFAGVNTRHPGVGLGIIAFGGLAFGGVAMGGLGVGVIALGGGAVGLVAIGGGSVGVIALGGGAVGWIAVGGGACGYYAMGQKAYGRHVLAFNRQDPEAVEFFKRWIPGVDRAVTNPMPVLPLPARAEA